jgi:hypothetical protein
MEATDETDLTCGYIRRTSKPRLRLVRVDPMDPAQVVPTRIEGPYVKRVEVNVLARYLALGEAKEAVRRQGGKPQYMEIKELSAIAQSIFERERARLLERACDRLLRR